MKMIKLLPACLVVAAGVFLFAGCASMPPRPHGETCVEAVCAAAPGEEKFRQGVRVDGVEVGGMTYAEAERAVYENGLAALRRRSLTVRAGTKTYRYYYPEIGCETDLADVLPRALAYGARAAEKKELRAGGADFPLEKTYYLNNEREVLEGIAADVRVRPRDSELVFRPENGSFVATEPRYGCELDVAALALKLPEALKEESAAVEGEFYETPPAVFPGDLDKYTCLRARFSTNYGSSADNRKHNVALASRKISGTRLLPGERFSFNAIVGGRTEANGFLPAKVILSGKYIEGVGGGVCQVSTTLYNAALLAGLKVTEHHPHTLSVGYVKPSFDAMVNSVSSDMKFVNVTEGPVFVRMICDGRRLTAEIYGLRPDAVYERKSVILREIPSVGREEVEDDTGELAEGETRILQYAKSGIVSEGYLVAISDGVRTETKLRADRYQPVKEIVAVGKSRPEETCQF